MVRNMIVLREERVPLDEDYCSLWLCMLCLGNREYEIYTDAEDDKEKATKIAMSIAEALRIEFIEEREHVCHTVQVPVKK